MIQKLTPWPLRLNRGLVLALILSVVLGACAKSKPASIQVDPALSILIPPDTILLAAANLEALKKTPVYQKHLANRSVPQLDEIGKFTGIDPRKDLWQLVMPSDGKHTVVLARGYFQSEMESRLEREGAEIVGHKMYHLVGNEAASVVFFNSTTVAVGNRESLKALLDARGSSNGPPPAIAARLKEIPSDAQAWIVYTGGGMKLPFDLKGNLANLDRIVQSVNTGSMYFDLRDGLKSVARGTAPTEEEAKMLHDALKGFIGMGRLMAPTKQPELLRMLDGLQVTQEGTNVTFRIDESPDLVDRLITLAAPR